LSKSFTTESNFINEIEKKLGDSFLFLSLSLSHAHTHTHARLHFQYSPPVIPWILEEVAKLNTVLQPAHLDDNMEANSSRLCSPANTMAWSAFKAFSVQAEQVVAC